MPLSIEGRPSEAQAIRTICGALDGGIDFIDTADVYCIDDGDIGHNERLIAKALDEWNGGHEVLVATKGGVRRPGGDWTHDGRRSHIRRACEASLRALGTERIGLDQLHAPDPRVPFEETLGALADLQREGKIEHLGLSNVGLDHLWRAQSLVPVVSVQNQANPYHPRGLKDGVLEACEVEGIAFIAYSPVGGWRAGRIAHEPLLQEIWQRHGSTPFQVVLAWLLAKSPNLIAIPGASRPENALASVAALELELQPSDLQRLDKEFLSVG